MTDIVQVAQAYLEHCRGEAEFFIHEGEEETADMWTQQADEAERAIKAHLDGDQNPRRANWCGAKVEIVKRSSGVIEVGIDGPEETFVVPLADIGKYNH